MKLHIYNWYQQTCGLPRDSVPHRSWSLVAWEAATRNPVALATPILAGVGYQILVVGDELVQTLAAVVSLLGFVAVVTSWMICV